MFVSFRVQRNGVEKSFLIDFSTSGHFVALRSPYGTPDGGNDYMKACLVALYNKAS
jgi:hypothetical protein